MAARVFQGAQQSKLSGRLSNVIAHAKHMIGKGREQVGYRPMANSKIKSLGVTGI
jgi:hypothetical protein